VTVPFKEEALALADFADDAARLSGAANLLLFHEDGRIEARNTDGLGLLYAFSQQAPDWRPAAGPIVLLGAGGAARGAVAALKLAGASDIRILNRTRSRAETLARELGARAFDFGEADKAFDGALCLINATSGQLSGEANLPLPGWAAAGAVAMDMVYKPLFTPFLQHAKARGFRTVDGLDMLIGQARHSFSAFYGVAPPAEPDVRALLLERLEVRP
jgi:shikimate dehydrogenase